MGVRQSTGWTQALTRRLLLWLPLSLLLWTLLTPAYNRFLIEATGNVVGLLERPNATRLERLDRHYMLVSRMDGTAGGQLPRKVRVTDVHFHLVLLAGLFLAVPGVPLRRRLANLGTASLVAVIFHIVDLFFWVRFLYATQLGAWSVANYGPIAQNFYGLGKHLLDLPVKLGLPLLLWGVYYFRELLPAPRRTTA